MTDLHETQLRHIVATAESMLQQLEHLAECVEEHTEGGDDLRTYTANVGTWLVPLKVIATNRLQQELNQRHIDENDTDSPRIGPV